MKFDIIKGARTLIKTNENETLRCFKCKGHRTAKTSQFYYCMAKQDVFCDRCKGTQCEVSNRAHIDHIIDDYVGFVRED